MPCTPMWLQHIAYSTIRFNRTWTLSRFISSVEYHDEESSQLQGMWIFKPNRYTHLDPIVHLLLIPSPFQTSMTAQSSRWVGTWAEMVSVTWLKGLILAHDIMVPTITSTNPFPSNSYISWSVSLDNGSGPDHLTWKWSQLKDKDLKQDDDQIPHIILSPVPDDHAKITSYNHVPTNRVFLKSLMFNGCLG
jgi:hypothetical protein